MPIPELADMSDPNVTSHVRTWRRHILRGNEERRKQLRYVVSSAISVIVGEAVLAVAFGVLRWPPMPSNVVSFITAGVVAYVLQRTWTWRRTGRSRFLRELLPYWVIALVSLVLSTLAVEVVARVSWRITERRSIVTGLVMIGALLVNGLFWLIKYWIFDRYLFGDGSTTDPASQGER